MTKQQTTELKQIADTLRVKRNDPATLVAFQNLVKRLTPRDRAALAETLVDMLAGR